MRRAPGPPRAAPRLRHEARAVRAVRAMPAAREVCAVRAARAVRAVAVLAVLALALRPGAAGAARRPKSGAVRAAASGPLATRVLLERLRSAGRGEAAVRVEIPDPLGDGTRSSRGRLALELPRFSRLDFAGGESLTLREEGGEWLQPRARQLVRSGPRNAAPALHWSELLLESSVSRVRERALGGRGFELAFAGRDSSERQRVWLDAAGLPVRLEVSAGDAVRTYYLSGWRFTRARGADAFVLRAPPGYEVLDLP